MVPAKLSLNTLAKNLVRCLEASGIRVEGLYLFGSHARNEARKTSDLDILLVSPTFTSRKFLARCVLVAEAIGKLRKPIQVYPVTGKEFRNPEPGGFLEAIAPELKSMYTRKQKRKAS